MDYIEAFQNLKTNQKYSRKSPHKAVLLLTVIKMYENGLLSDNEIKYDGTLTRTFKQVWNNLLPHETKFFPDAYLPYWYLQNESFWHIIPIRGQESVLQLMRDEHIKPSETKLQNCVSYAELDEELFFQISMPSCRKKIKQVLLDSYFDLSERSIHEILNDDPCEQHNSIDANATYKNVFTKKEKVSSGYEDLTEDVQIILNLEYFSYLKTHRYEREGFKELFPDVKELYKRIVDNPIRYDELTSSNRFEYTSFLRDLKISLMCEDDAMSFVEAIDHSLETLEDVQVKEETSIDVTNCDDTYQDGDYNRVIVDEIAPVESISGQSDALSNLPELKPAEESRNGKRWTEDELINLQFYFEKGYNFDSIATALGRSEVSIKSKLNALGLIEYDYEAERIKKLSEEGPKTEEEKQVCEEEEVFNYEPKGKIAKIKDIAQNTYDLLWMIAIVDLETVSNRRGSHTLDELACMMIAHAWELLNKNPKAKEKENELRKCIEYLIEESKEYMDIKLSWESTKDKVFEAIKDYPMAGIFEDTVESLVYEAPFNILRAWYPEKTDFEIITNSQNFTKPCLYAFFNKKIDPFITINKGWQGNIFYDHDKLLKYFVMEYKKFVEGR